jgi:hypothetical protein
MTLTSCNNDDIIDKISSISSKDEIKVNSPMGFIDQTWSPRAVLLPNLLTPEDTNFMYAQLNKIATFWGQPVPPMKFVSDPGNPVANSTNLNAESYPQGYIYYGYPLYYKAKNEAGNIANVAILAHEYGHQLQFKFNIPLGVSVSRDKELEADGFSGYFLGRNNANFQQITTITNFSMNFADASIAMPDHGTWPQRRSAVRVGYLLSQVPIMLTPQQFDQQFFYYYATVLNGTAKSSSKSDLTIDQYMSKHIDELKRIKNGEMSEEEYRNLH